MAKIKIALISPESKWWPYHIYKELNEFFISKWIDSRLINTKSWYLLAHFQKYDYILSVIPFLFKPILSNFYLFNPRWNWELEKFNKRLWNKLLYLSNYNLKFCDNIILTSYFLADKLNFKEKYIDKIHIFPNFINPQENKLIQKDKFSSTIKIITITSFKFYQKWLWIINLWNIISTLWKSINKNIEWTIVWKAENKNFFDIYNIFKNINFSKNTKVIMKWWLKKEEIQKELLSNDIFIYWTELDNFPTILLESMSNWLITLANDFDSFKYFLPKEILMKSEEEMINKLYKIINNNDFTLSYTSIEFSKKFDKNKVINEFLNYILVLKK